MEVLLQAPDTLLCLYETLGRRWPCLLEPDLCGSKQCSGVSVRGGGETAVGARRGLPKGNGTERGRAAEQVWDF